MERNKPFYRFKAIKRGPIFEDSTELSHGVKQPKSV